MLQVGAHGAYWEEHAVLLSQKRRVLSASTWAVQKLTTLVRISPTTKSINMVEKEFH